MAAGRLFDLSGHVALVTGASRGLGQHFALTLARHGAAVALCARDTAALQKNVALIQSEGGRAMAVSLDVKDVASVRACIEATMAQLGPVTILVNNAGVASVEPWDKHSEAEWDRVLDTNLKGVWLVAQQVGVHMAQHRKGGSIINVASIFGLVAVAEVPAYCASKAAVLHLTRSLAMAMAPHGIRVNALAPGYFETDLNRDYLRSPTGQEMLRRIPQRRIGRYEELDGPLVLLASEASRYMTGSVLVVDGGQSITL